MSGRRNHARFVVSSNEGVLQVARDVSVIWTDDGLIAISNGAVTVGDSLSIEVLVNGFVEQFTVRVEESRPIVTAGAIRHRIRLMRIHPSGSRRDRRTRDNTIAMEDRPNVPQGLPHAHPARLSRYSRVRLLNCSDAACLLETSHPVAVNTVAGLQVWFDGKAFDDVVRVVRCEPIVKSSDLYRVAVEFLSVSPAYSGSLRCLMRQEISDLDGGLHEVRYE
jgi:hypothetical protein